MSRTVFRRPVVRADLLARLRGPWGLAAAQLQVPCSPGEPGWASRGGPRTKPVDAGRATGGRAPGGIDAQAAWPLAAWALAAWAPPRRWLRSPGIRTRRERLRYRQRGVHLPRRPRYRSRARDVPRLLDGLSATRPITRGRPQPVPSGSGLRRSIRRPCPGESPSCHRVAAGVHVFYTVVRRTAAVGSPSSRRRWTRERDLDAVPSGQLADDEQPELVAVSEVELRRAGEAPVEASRSWALRPRPRSSTSATRPLPTGRPGPR